MIYIVLTSVCGILYQSQFMFVDMNIHCYSIISLKDYPTCSPLNYLHIFQKISGQIRIVCLFFNYLFFASDLLFYFGVHHVYKNF